PGAPKVRSAAALLSAIYLAEHRGKFGVGPELADLLCAAAGDRELRGPFEGGLSCGHIDDCDSADGLRGRSGGDRPVGGDDAGPLVFQSAGEEVYAGVDGLLNHRVRGLAHGWPVLVGDVIHRVRIERDQVRSHPLTSLSLRPSPGASTHRRTRCSESDTI